ncbi:hypothetical protein VTN00DRAFT_4785 [Thermoascus crustaceus]|uniref:uncharacterized protein n=1 Tax=Thermoascus crustaceus TaxID=5088 RepID=UPI003742057A
MGPVDAVPLLWARDAVSEVQSAPETFSSWDKCMQKSYCKWPVIVGIIVGGVIIIGIVWCLISCLCCGVQCCKGCADCCTCCCSCCSHGSSGGGGNRSKYADDPSPYHPPPPPSYGYQAPPGPPAYRGAQYARFDAPSNNKVDGDSLPPMPTWEGATTRRVEDTGPRSEDVEMNRLSPTGQPPGMAAGAGRQARGGYTEIPTSKPASPQPGYRGVEEPFARTRSPRPDPFAAGGPGAVGAAVTAPYAQPSRGNSPYENRPSPTNRPLNFHTPQPYGQGQSPMSPVSPPGQAAYASMPEPPGPSPVMSPGPLNQPRQPTPFNPPRQPSPLNEPLPTYIPDRQPSPLNQPRMMSPGPLNQPRQPTPFNPPRQPSPLNEPFPPTPVSNPPQQTYAAYRPQPQPTYAAYSPTTPSSPPPQFEETPNADRPPSLLQAGRKPAPNSWRDV